MRDVKNGSEYIGKKGNPIYNDILKKHDTDFLKIRINRNKGLISPTKIAGSRQVGAKI